MSRLKNLHSHRLFTNMAICQGSRNSLNISLTNYKQQYTTDILQFGTGCLDLINVRFLQKAWRFETYWWWLQSNRRSKQNLGNVTYIFAFCVSTCKATSSIMLTYWTEWQTSAEYCRWATYQRACEVITRASFCCSKKWESCIYFQRKLHFCANIANDSNLIKRYLHKC